MRLARGGPLLGAATALATAIIMVGGIVAGAAWQRAAAGARPPENFGPDLPIGPAPARGLAGEIWLVDPRGILVRDLMGRLRPVRVTAGTTIRLARGGRLTLDMLQPGDRVVVLGQRNPRGIFIARFVIVAQHAASAANRPGHRLGPRPPPPFPNGSPGEDAPTPPTRPTGARLVRAPGAGWPLTWRER